MDNLNCKIQAHTRVCKESKLEEKTMPIEIINFCDKRCEFEESYRKSWWTYQDDILKDDLS